MERIPPMLMQPFVENAVWHGLMNKNAQGSISIAFSRNQEHIKCTITDNGIGRKQAAELKKKQNGSQKSVGMSVTKDRLELHNRDLFRDLNVEVRDLFNAEGAPTGTQVILNIKTE
jgi:sensor histidine kinase YesM